MKLAPHFLLVAAIAALVLAGCSTVESRIKERPAAFAALDDQTRQKLPGPPHPTSPPSSR